MPLGARVDLGDARFVGRESLLDGASTPDAAVRDAARCGFDFVALPCAREEFARVDDSTYPRSPLMHSDRALESEVWSSRVVLRCSREAENDAAGGGQSGARALSRELRWAAHVGAHAAVVRCARSWTAGEEGVIGRILASHADSMGQTRIWARTWMTGDAAADDDAYRRWAATSAACDEHANVRALLHVTGAPASRREWERWLGERVGACALSVEAFVTNARGFPVLPKELQALVRALFERGVQVVLTDWTEEGAPTPKITPQDVAGDEARVSGDEAHSMRLYWEYLVYLFRGVEPLSAQTLAEVPYRDYLQTPLQPLMDNLESVTYETFERDASKYIQYEEAVRCALLDVVDERAEGVVMVVGAGRGPLVRASLRAAERANVRVKVYALEKNPNAVVTLQHLIHEEGWQGLVEIIPGDMRTAPLDVKADVLVSELLGSFGDNELSPECLDGAQRFLKSTGVSVPRSYASFVAPITAAKLHDAVAAIKDSKAMETPYVVKFHKIHSIGQPKEVWEFEHPNRDEIIDNERFARVEWTRDEIGDASATLHGFAAYFDCVLYDGPTGHVRCSIHPANHTMGPTGEPMFSWFPMYFPIRSPILVDGRSPATKKVELLIWRRVDAHKMWYEWAVTEPVKSHVHNSNGRSYWIGL